MNGIDLFSGAGGLSVGARWAGINITHAIENEKYAAQTYKYNHPDTNLICKDICDIDPSIFPKNTDIIFGGPPCQGFSLSNVRTRKRSNPKNWYFKEFFRFVEHISPKFVLLENVRGILETEGGYFHEKIISDLTKLGYLVNTWVLNACDFGVPQKRTRVFIVASKDIKINEPNAISPKFVTVEDAISDLPKLENGSRVHKAEYHSGPKSLFSKQLRNGSKASYNNMVTNNSVEVIERYKHIPQGGNWKNIPRSLMKSYSNVENCHTGIYHRLNHNKPSIVIGNYRKNMLIHPIEDRGLSVREAARIQSFPDNYRFLGTIGFQQQQVGNAVPPLLAKAVFMKLKEL